MGSYHHSAFYCREEVLGTLVSIGMEASMMSTDSGNHIAPGGQFGTAASLDTKIPRTLSLSYDDVFPWAS